MADQVVTERLETLLLARLSTVKQPPTEAALAGELQRYAPAMLDAAAWRDRVVECLHGLEDRKLIDGERRVVRDDELKRRTGAHAAQRWQNWTERILPALALGVRADDAKAHKRLKERDDWAAAIVGRRLGVWTRGVPPTAVAMYDALTWRALGLTSSPKKCPAEVRAHFLRSYIEVDDARPDKLLRQLAAKLIAAPRVELKAFYAVLLQAWLVGRDLGAEIAAEETAASHEGIPEPSLIDAVRSAARDARDGLFGDRKVFISSVWHALRATPPWSRLELDDFKTRLLSAHRKRELELARADLVAAMDPALVAASETRTDGATFHFIVREPLQ
jgi:hypothetical protein